MLSVTFLSEEFNNYALVVKGHISQKLRLACSYLSIHPCIISKTYFLLLEETRLRSRARGKGGEGATEQQRQEAERQGPQVSCSSKRLLMD